jgi:hypothetical protein
VAVPVALRLGSLLVATRDPAALDQDIVVVGLTVELHECEGDQAGLHRALSMPLRVSP